MTGFDVSFLHPITAHHNRQNGLVLADRLALNYITRHRMAQAYAERIRPVPPASVFVLACGLCYNPTSLALGCFFFPAG
jgi:hypothetical protein